MHRQALLWGNPNSHVNARCLRAAFTTLARSCTGAKPELAAAALKHLRRFVKPSLGGKAFKTEPPIVFFPLDPKKRHLQWATWSVFGSSKRPLVAFPKIRKSATRIEKTGGASALPFLWPFSRWHCVRRGKVEGRGYTVLTYTYGFDSEYARSSRHCVALDSLLDAASTSAHLAALVDAAVQHPSNVSRTTA